uniref:MHC class I-like antigen recognition-like domain-containing protein n=1 Tax=Podarcis muralis TaxID=64176 RepID=A0A670HMX5_PODMU
MKCFVLILQGTGAGKGHCYKPTAIYTSDLPFGGSTSHSLRYFYTAVSEPGQELPQFIMVGYVDDQPFVQYDSDTKEALPQVPWIRKAEKEDPQYWKKITHLFQDTERVLCLLIRKGRGDGQDVLQPGQKFFPLPFQSVPALSQKDIFLLCKKGTWE